MVYILFFSLSCFGIDIILASETELEGTLLPSILQKSLGYYSFEYSMEFTKEIMSLKFSLNESFW